MGRPEQIRFEKHPLDLGSSVSAAIAGACRLDIVCGENWYEAPHWTKHHFREFLYTNNYIDDLSTLPLDFDGDAALTYSPQTGSVRSLPGGETRARPVRVGMSTRSKRAFRLNSHCCWI
jgi:hypothetical protein